MTDYKTAATNNFNALKEFYESNYKKPIHDQTSFWKLGNTFDTMIDYLEFVDQSPAKEVAQMVVPQFYCSLGRVGGYSSAWFDDFGWWTVATQRAQQKPFFDQNAKAQFAEIMNECWPRFKANAPFVWERREPGSYKDYGPAYQGGVWNAYWLNTSPKYPGPNNGDPKNGHLVGIQNTVTNALYLMAAQRIDGWTKETTKNEFTFLQNWLNDAQAPLWGSIDAEAGLVRERVGRYANVNPAPGFQTDWFWTGDQGLMLGNLSDAQIAGVVPNLDRAKQLIAGVTRKLVKRDKTLLNYILLNYTTPTQEIWVPDGDTNDYEIGSSVFWRNALYVWRTNRNWSTFVHDIEPMLVDSAGAAAKSSDKSFDALTNQTSVLVAATAMLK